MQILSGMDIKLTNTAVTLGKFDGIHRGHKMLLDRIIAEKDLTSVMFTFDMHPRNLFSEEGISLIETEEERERYLKNTGLDYLVLFPFTKETASMEPEEFIREILAGKLGAKLVVVGTDFRFGKNRSGDTETLKEFSSKYGFETVVYDKLFIEGIEVSSTEVRKAVTEGDVSLAGKLLGRPYSIFGTVIRGRSLGHTVGMPTANQALPAEKLIPPYGVYATDVCIDDRIFRGVTNIGVKPTVGAEPAPLAETLILDFDGDLYGKQIELRLLKFLRPERKMASLEEVKDQVEKDAYAARCL